MSEPCTNVSHMETYFADDQNIHSDEDKLIVTRYVAELIDN